MPALAQKEESMGGWEEPSPESVRRRNEIDDGTSAWGDPAGKHGRPHLTSVLKHPFTFMINVYT